MTRDMDLIRFILIFIESGVQPQELRNYQLDQVKYHYVLLKDAGFIDAHFVEGNDVLPDEVMNERLTWAGHEFLDAARDNTIWKKAKENVLKPGISWTVSALFEWLKQEAKTKLLGLPPAAGT